MVSNYAQLGIDMQTNLSTMANTENEEKNKQASILLGLNAVTLFVDIAESLSRIAAAQEIIANEAIRPRPFSAD